MAQDFRRYMLQGVGTVAADIPDGGNFDSYDTLVGIHLTNILTNAITVDVYIQHTINGTPTDHYLIRGAPIAAGGALQLLDGGAKIVVQTGDRLWVKSDTASSLDVWVSAVDAISAQEQLMAYIGNQQTQGFSSIPAKQDLTGATGTTLTLSHAVSSPEAIDLYINNVRQEPTTAYSAAATTVTLTGSVVASDDIYVVYNALALQTSVPPDGSVTSAKLDPNLVLGGGSFLGDSGGGTADIFRVHQDQLDTSVTVVANTNALCAGPLTVATGVTVTVNGNLVIA